MPVLLCTCSEVAGCCCGCVAEVGVLNGPGERLGVHRDVVDGCGDPSSDSVVSTLDRTAWG
eukprot:5786991-Alexandrium_andersonii.AAC.1